MPQGVPGIAWLMLLFFGRFDIIKEVEVPVYICNDCGLDFNFKVSKEYPIPFCIFCKSNKIEQIGTAII
jgi:hypothetical protein